MTKKKIDLTNKAPIEIYKLVSTGQISRFPYNYWNGVQSYDNSIEIIKYLFETKLKWNEEDIKENLTFNTFIDNKLKGMFHIIYKNSPYNAIKDLYPNIKPWEMKCVSMNYWNEDTAKEATKWLIEEKLKWSEEDIKEKLTADIFINNRLNGMFQIVYNNRVYNTIKDLYPNIKPEDMKNKPRSIT